MPQQPSSGEDPAESWGEQRRRYRPKSVYQTVRKIAGIVAIVMLPLIFVLKRLMATNVGGDVTVYVAGLAGAAYLVACAVATADDAPQAAPLTFWRVVLLGFWVLLTFALLLMAFALLTAGFQVLGTANWPLLLINIGVTLLIVLLCAWLYRAIREKWRLYQR